MNAVSKAWHLQSVGRTSSSGAPQGRATHGASTALIRTLIFRRVTASGALKNPKTRATTQLNVSKQQQHVGRPEALKMQTGTKKVDLHPPPRIRVVCGSQMASTCQHNKSLVSGTTGAFRLRSDK